MNYYYVYSAGGGGGDWDGVKRVWKQYMPESNKSHVLLKFGDIFLEHATGNNFIRPQRWHKINNLRDWLYSGVNDSFVADKQKCNILLDSGTAKAVNNIAQHNPRISCENLINIFENAFEENAVFEKYVDVVYNSQINKAVTFDIPNPFKIRSQNGNARLNIIDRETNNAMVELAARYANRLYDMFCNTGGRDYAENTLTTIVNGLWSEEEINRFFESLDYSPNRIAVGALSSVKASDFNRQIQMLVRYNIVNYESVHFLGCGGFNKILLLKEKGIDGENISVDCTTFHNRSIDGSINGNSKSGYYEYDTQKLNRISPTTKQRILNLHEQAESPLYSVEEMEEIIDGIILHQSGHPSYSTYDERAKLSFHNFDVFKRFAE